MLRGVSFADQTQNPPESTPMSFKGLQYGRHIVMWCPLLHFMQMSCLLWAQSAHLGEGIGLLVEIKERSKEGKEGSRRKRKCLYSVFSDQIESLSWVNNSEGQDWWTKNILKSYLLSFSILRGKPGYQILEFVILPGVERIQDTMQRR
jgi:hypothetical protein